LAILASVAAAAAATAQTPTDQSQLPSQNPPGPQNPNDPSTSASPPAGAPEQTGVAGGTSGGRSQAQEEIVVTGSRVRRKDLTTPAPVTVINREQINASGFAAIGDFLQTMPEQGGALNTNVNNGGNGVTAISLRNLGAQRTLVLVDGKRWVNGGSGANSYVDLNSIPTAGIERIEVLKDGASAVYGSDAIAGVVNIITRRRVNGVELSGYGGTSPHGDAQQYDLGVTGGSTSDRGSFLFSAGYFDQKAMFAGNRDWAKTPLTFNYDVPNGAKTSGASALITPGGSPTIPNGRAAVNLNACNGNALCTKLAAAFKPAICPGSTCNKTFIFDDKAPACAAGFVASASSDFQACQIDNWRPMVGTALNAQNGPGNDLYNFQAVNYLITPSQRIQLFSNGDFNVSNFARAYFQGSFVNRQSETVLAAEPLSTGAFGTRMGADNIYNPFGKPGDPACAATPTPAGCGQTLSAARRLVDAGGRSSGYDINTVRAVAGMDGTLPEAFGPLQGVFWDVSFNYGRTWGTTTYNGSVNTGVTANALVHTSPDGASCLDASGSAIPGCTPANLFGGPGTVTPAMLNSMGIYTGVNSGFTQLVVGQGNVSAELFKLGAERPLGLAAGYEYRGNYGGFTPDPIGAAGLSFDFNSLPTKGSYHSNEGYAELNAPLISGMPLAEDLELQAAARVFNYNTFGSDWTYKLGLRYRPIRDVTIRGTFGTGFRAPDVSDLYGGAGPSAEPATDPCANADISSPNPVLRAIAARCNQFGPTQGAGTTAVAGNGDPSQQINSTIGGRTGLQPEKAKIGTVGIVFEPTMLRRFSATLDYYNIKVDQNLGNITTAVILKGCYEANYDPYCNLITRTSADGTITDVNDLTTNVGRVQTSGLDFALRYNLPTDFGRFGFLFDSTYLIFYRQVLGGNVGTISAAGNYDIGSGTAIGSLTPKFKFNAGLDYGIAGLQAGLRMRYIGGFDECADSGGTSAGGGLCSLPSVFDPTTGDNVPSGTPGAISYPAHHVSAYTQFDLLASYMFRNPAGNTTFAVGVRNLFDKKPPYVYNETFIFTDPGYDLVGRFVYGRISHAF
jgi:outer membrane receptor protein involved in Fe transport